MNNQDVNDARKTNWGAHWLRRVSAHPATPSDPVLRNHEFVS